MGEIIKMTKWWWAWNFDKEEEWLNEMAEKGYALIDAWACFYTFEKTEPGEYIIRLEYQNEGVDYLDFLKDIGAERVARYAGWNFFRRKSSLGPFDIYSDLSSKIAHLKKIERLLAALGFMNLGVGIINTINVPHIGYINLFLAAIIFYGYGCVKTKRDVLEREKNLHE